MASDPFVRAALAVGVGSIAVAVAMLAAVTVLRLRLRARTRLEQTVIATWRPVLAQCIEEIPPQLPPLEPRAVEVFLRLWIRTQESVRGDARERLNAVARALGLERTAYALLAQRRPQLRMLAVAALGHLRARGAQPTLRALAADPRPWLALAAAQAWLRIDEANALAPVLALAARRDDWALGRVADLLRDCARERSANALAQAIAAALPPAPPAGLVRLLKIAALAAADVGAAAAAVLQAAEDAEAIAAALALLNSPQHVEHARRQLRHAHWHVRMEAVRALGRIGGAADFDALVAALSDPSWWVRYRAAQALIDAPWLSFEQLERIPQALADRFAADILVHARAEAA
jgi:hypothetical protein